MTGTGARGAKGRSSVRFPSANRALRAGIRVLFVVALAAFASAIAPASASVRSASEGKTSCAVSLRNSSHYQPARTGAVKGGGDRWSPEPPEAIRDGNGGTGAFFRSVDDPGDGCSNVTTWKLNYGQECPLKSTPPSPCTFTVRTQLKKDGKGGFDASTSCDVSKSVISCPRIKIDHDEGSPQLEVVYDICYQKFCSRH